MRKHEKVGILIIIVLAVISSMSYASENVKKNNDLIYSKDADIENGTSLLFVGDIMLGRNVEKDSFRYVKNLIDSSDISSGNLEYAITENNFGADKKIKLKSSCDNSEQLEIFDTMSLANNHIMDYGENGLNDTINCLDKLLIGHTGAGSNISEASELEIINVNNLSIGFLAYTSISPEFAYATKNRPGVAGLGEKNIFDNIKDSRSKVDFLVVITHWGIEYSLEQNEYQTKTGHKLIDAGADLVIGSHPHVMEPYEIYKGKYIFYSLGNFVFDQKHDVTKNSMAVRLNLDNRSQVLSVEKINLVIDDTRPYVKSVEKIS